MSKYVSLKPYYGHLDSSNMDFFLFSCFENQFCPTWIRIPNLVPDLLTQLNSDSKLLSETLETKISATTLFCAN
jgi:hypothetical protein